MDINALILSLWAWIEDFLTNLLPVYIFPNLEIIIKIAIILIVGYVVGKFGKYTAVKILSVTGLRKLFTRSWAESVIKTTGYKGNVVELVGDLIKWLIYILFFAFILQIAGLQGAADLFSQIAIFVPRFIVAILLFVIGFIIADLFGKIFEDAGTKFLKEEVLGKLLGGFAKYSIAIIIIIMALALLGLDTQALLILFSALLVIMILVIGISIKDIIPDFSAGLHLKNTLKIGDRIKFSNYEGVVEAIDTMSVKLKTRKGTVIIPNSLLLKSPIEKKRMR